MADSFETPASPPTSLFTRANSPYNSRAMGGYDSNDFTHMLFIREENGPELVSMHEIPPITDGLSSPSTVEIDIASDASSDIYDAPDIKVEDSYASTLEDATPPTTLSGESPVKQEDTEGSPSNAERHTRAQILELRRSVIRLFDLQRQRGDRRRRAGRRRRIKELARAERETKGRKEAQEFAEAAREREEARRSERREYLAYWRSILREQSRRDWEEMRRTTDWEQVSEVGRSQMRDEWPKM